MFKFTPTVWLRWMHSAFLIYISAGATYIHVHLCSHGIGPYHSGHIVLEIAELIRGPGEFLVEWRICLLPLMDLALSLPASTGEDLE